MSSFLIVVPEQRKNRGDSDETEHSIVLCENREKREQKARERDVISAQVNKVHSVSGGRGEIRREQ